jgi:hypothetical protein
MPKLKWRNPFSTKKKTRSAAPKILTSHKIQKPAYELGRYHDALTGLHVGQTIRIFVKTSRLHPAKQRFGKIIGFDESNRLILEFLGRRIHISKSAIVSRPNAHLPTEKEMRKAERIARNRKDTRPRAEIPTQPTTEKI